MIYRTKEILKKRHRAILPFILSLVGKALLENMKKSAKGEEADATINPLDVVKGIKYEDEEWQKKLQEEIHRAIA